MRLQTYYIPGVEELLSRETLLNDNIKRAKDVKVEGSEFVFLTHTGRNEGHGWRAEGEDLPDSGYQKYNPGKIPVFFYYHKGSITGQGLSAAAGPHAYLTEIQNEIKRIMGDALREFNIYNFGDQSGVRATVASVAGNVVTCSWTHVYGENGVNQIRPDMSLSIRDAGSTTNRLAVNFRVVSVNHITRTFIAGPKPNQPPVNFGDTVAGDLIYIAGNWDPLNGSKQCLGLQNGVDDGGKGAVYLNIARLGFNTVPEWQSVVMGDETAPVPLTLAQLQNLERLVDENAPEPEQVKNNIYITSFGVRDSYFLDLIALPDRRWIANDKPLKYDAGFVGVDYNAKAWYVDRDCPRGYRFYLNMPTWRKAILDDWDFLKDLKPDSGILILNNNKDQYTFTMRRYLSGPYCVSPRMNGLQKGILDPGSSVIN